MTLWNVYAGSVKNNLLRERIKYISLFCSNACTHLNHCLLSIEFQYVIVKVRIYWTESASGHACCWRKLTSGDVCISTASNIYQGYSQVVSLPTLGGGERLLMACYWCFIYEAQEFIFFQTLNSPGTVNTLTCCISLLLYCSVRLHFRRFPFFF